MKLKLFAALLLAVSAVSCGGVVSPSSNKQDQFTLSVPPAGSAAFAFNVTTNGSLEYSVFVASVTPTPPSGLGLALGQLISGSCAPIQSGLYTEFNHTTLSGTIQQGSWCIVAFDPYGTYSSVPFPTTTTVTGYVSHP